MAKLPDKYKGQSFADISKNIQKNYQDRYDPISQRGLMNEMDALRSEQEYVKAKQEIKANLEALLANPQGVVPEQSQQNTAPEIINNQGVNVQPIAPQSNPTFNHAASQTYNQQFANGGILDRNPLNMPNFQQGLVNAALAGEMSLQNAVPNGINYNAPQTPISTGVAPQGNNLLRYAPLAGNLFNIITARKPNPIQDSLSRTSVNEGLATRVAPRQTQFSNINFSPIERGINQQARSFTGNNLNVSGGNAGAFTANELANQSNVMNAIASARLQQQQSDQQTTAMNAQEQARVDQFRQAQNMQQAQIQGQNIGLEMQMEDLNARDRGAYSQYVSSNINDLFGSLGSIGREQDMMDMIANTMGYNSFGQYMNNIDPSKRQGLVDYIQNIFKARNK